MYYIFECGTHSGLVVVVDRSRRSRKKIIAACNRLCATVTSNISNAPSLPRIRMYVCLCTREWVWEYFFSISYYFLCSSCFYVFISFGFLFSFLLRTEFYAYQNCDVLSCCCFFYEFLANNKQSLAIVMFFPFRFILSHLIGFQNDKNGKFADLMACRGLMTKGVRRWKEHISFNSLLRICFVFSENIVAYTNIITTQTENRFECSLFTQTCLRCRRACCCDVSK